MRLKEIMFHLFKEYDRTGISHTEFIDLFFDQNEVKSILQQYQQPYKNDDIIEKYCDIAHMETNLLKTRADYKSLRKLVGYILSQQNTESKKIEEALKETNSKIRELTEDSDKYPDSINYHTGKLMFLTKIKSILGGE